MGVMMVVMMVVLMVVIMVVVWWFAGFPRPSVWPLVGLHTPHTSLHTLSLMALTARLWP